MFTKQSKVSEVSMKNQSSSRSFGALALYGVLLLFTVHTVPAQTGASTVRGTVLDQQGNAVPGVAITILNSGKNFSRTQTTDGRGNYVFSTLPPGKYRIEAEAAGFKKGTVNDVSAQVETPLEINISLVAGDISETVSVPALSEAPLNTTDATIGNTFEERRIEDLPLNGRNVNLLLSLQPFVTQHGEVSGARRDQSNILLDGIDVNEQQSGLDIVAESTNDVNDAGLDANALQQAFASVLRATPESVQEFRVIASVPTASLGRSSGGQVSLVTKSGTNEFHGTLFEFHRNTKTTANDFFNNAAGRYVAGDQAVIDGLAKVGDSRVPRPKLLRNIFGGSIGGPVMKDRFFFFYTYEGRRDAAEKSVLRTVPTATLRNGIVRYENAAGGTTTLTPAEIANLYPATGGVNPAALALLRTAPLPNDFSIGDKLNTAGYRFNAVTPVEFNTHIARLDYVLNDRQTIFARANYQQDNYGLGPQFPATPAPALWAHPLGFVIGDTWTINHSVVNNFRAGLTRQAFSVQGDSTGTGVDFRFVYTPFLYSRTLSRTTPAWNITDDISWIKGAHSLQFGANIRLIRNNRSSLAASFDEASTNPSFYANSGDVLLDPIPDVTNSFDTKSAIAAVLGRFSDYTVNAVFDRSGAVLPAGSPSTRSFATEEYEFYGQDTWKMRPNLTLTYGLRWGVSTPVYERQGFEVKPVINVSDLFERRQQAAFNGRSVNDLITVDLAGKANGRPGFYDIDWNNFAPQVSVAWSPDFGDNFFGRAVGRNGRSVFRGGFRMVYDRIGSQLAVTFDLNNALGFSSSTRISANTFNVTDRLAPLFSGLNQDVRALPLIAAPQPLQFPLTFPADGQTRIEQSIDDSLKTPVQYTWNLSYGRELPKGLSLELSYVGRAGRHLLLARDVMQFNNLRDPQSGQDWYTAAALLAGYRNQNRTLDNVPAIPYFENLFPTLGNDVLGNPSLSATQAAYFLVAKDGRNITDWTLMQSILDDASTVIGPNAFIHPQFATLGVFSTVGSADYHGGSISLRERFSNDLIVDFNYTLSKSMDDSSVLEASTVLDNLIRQPFNLKAQRAVSDFDVRHSINANWLIGLPFGRGKAFLRGLSAAPEALLGGWQLTGVFRYHSGLPAGQPFDVGRWATNWQITSRGVRIRPVDSDNRNNVAGFPNIFSDPEAAYNSYRNALAGEAGDRNTLRIPGYIALDVGLTKAFKMWYSETDKLQFRCEVFNVTNTQRPGVIANFSLNQDPFETSNPEGRSEDFGRYIGAQLPVGESRPGRIIQFALRYVF
jgi:Carboxypeptidase regulatory-like domain